MAEDHLTCLSVVMPAYNKAATLASVVRKVLKVPRLLEIVIRPLAKVWVVKNLDR